MYENSENSILKHLDFMIFDLVCLMGSLWLALFFHLGVVNPFGSDIYTLTAILITLIHVCLALFSSEYKNILRRGYLEEFRSVAQHVLLILVVMLLCMFFTKNSLELSRAVIIYFVIFSLVFMTLERDLWKLFLRKHISKNPRQMLLVADEAGAERILKSFEEGNHIDFHIAGVVLVEKEGDLSRNPDIIRTVPVVAHTNTMIRYLTDHPVDEVLFAASKDRISQDLIDQCNLAGITVHLELTPMADLGADKYYENLADIPVLTSYIKLVTPEQMALKRLMDIIGGLVGLLFTGILFIFVAPMIYFTDPGPIFYAQYRVGKNGKVFKLYKFRSMYQNADEQKWKLIKENGLDPRHFKMDDDPRILGSGEDGKKRGVGYFIRRTSIDEFPQFWNILKGDMSLVGTRPPTVDEYQQYEFRHRARLATKPGLTGLWQISGRSDVNDFSKVVELDIQYIQNWSIWEDIKILAKTVLVVITGKGAK